MQDTALRRDARQRGAEIALHVDGQGLERRNVQNPATLLFCWSLREHEAVYGRQKGCKRLPGPGGREQKGGFSRENWRPAEGLRTCGSRKRRLEPPLDGGVESG